MTDIQKERLDQLLLLCDQENHIWQYYSSDMEIDPLTFKPKGNNYTILFKNAAPTNRGCIICGKTEKQKIE